MVEKGAGTALAVFDEPLIIGAPKLAMSPAHDFALEANRSGGQGIAQGIGSIVVSFGIAT